MFRQRYRLIPSRYWWSKKSWIWLAQRHIWPHSTKSGSLKCYLALMIDPMKKIKMSIDSFHSYCWSKNPSIWFDERRNRPQSTKKWQSHVLPSLDEGKVARKTPCKKSKRLINLRPKKLRSLDSFYRYWWLKHHTICLDDRPNMQHQTKTGSLTVSITVLDD